jgi:hypothetical protein
MGDDVHLGGNQLRQNLDSFFIHFFSFCGFNLQGVIKSG